MRIVRKVLGWFVSVALFALLVAFALVGQAGSELFDFVPTWVWWAIVGGYLVFLAWALLNPKARRQWRQAREEARARRRKLTNFDLD